MMRRLESLKESSDFRLVLVLAAAAVCFLPAVVPALSGDDFVHVFRNRLPFTNWPDVFLEPDGREYRPLVRLSLALDLAIWGKNFVGLHATNLLLHLLAVCLVYRLAGSWFGNAKSASLAAALFALHPIHSYSVNAVMGRTDILCALFLMGAVLALQRARPAVGLLLFAGALLSKETALALPILLGVGVLLSGREERRSLFVLAAALLTGASYLVLRLWLLAPQMEDLSVYLQFSPGQLVRNAAYYGGALLVPAGLFQLRSLLETQPWLWLFPGLALLGGLAVLWRLRRQLLRVSPAVWVSLAWLVVFVLPVLPLFQRRYLYIPSIGFALAAGWCLGGVQGRLGGLIRGGLLLGLGGLTLWAALIWRDAADLSRHYLKLLTPLVESHPHHRLQVVNVPHGVGEAHLFTHDSLRYAMALEKGSLPRLESLTRIQLARGQSWETWRQTSGVRTRIVPGPESYFVFDSPELLPQGGRSLAPGTVFQKNGFAVTVTAVDERGRVSEIEVRPLQADGENVLVVLQEQAPGFYLAAGPPVEGYEDPARPETR